MRFMLDIGITICIVMVASLLVALTVVPMVAAFLLQGETKGSPCSVKHCRAATGT